jgi:hypothetical protein
MRVVRADQEQHNWYTEQELLRWGVLVPIVNLLPHVEVIKGSSVEVEWDTAHVVEHKVGTRHVRKIDQGPRCFLRHAGHDIEQDLAEEDEDDVDCPRACTCELALVPSLLHRACAYISGSPLTLCIHPFCVQVGQGRLVAELLQRLGRFLVDKTTATSPPSLLGFQRHGVA